MPDQNWILPPQHSIRQPLALLWAGLDNFKEAVQRSSVAGLNKKFAILGALRGQDDMKASGDILGEIRLQ